MFRLASIMADWREKFCAWNRSIPGGWKAALIGAAGVTIFGLALWLLQWIAPSPWTNKSYDSGFVFQPRTSVDEVAIVYMDEESHYKLGLTDYYFKQWPRSIHARLLNRLREWNVKAVGLDILCVEGAGGLSEEDRQLVEAARQMSNLVLAARRDPVEVDGKIIGYNLDRPFRELEEAATAWGIAEEADPSFHFREHARGTKETPTLAWQLATLTSPHPPPPESHRWIRYYGPPGIIPHYSYWDVLSGPPELGAYLSNKVVLVGAKFGVGFTGGIGTDDSATPYTFWTGTKSPGVEITATVYLNLLRGDWLSRLAPGTECLILAFSGLLLGTTASRLRPLSFAGLGMVLALVIGVGAIWMMWQSFIWFPWLVVSLGQIPVAAGWSLLLHNQRLLREKRSLETEMALERMRSELEKKVILDPTRSMASTPSGRSRRTDPENPLIPDHTLIRRFAQGAYGEVWLARDAIGTYHAVKIIHRNNFPTAKPYEREFRGITKFTPISRSHRGFVHILHVGRNDDSGCIYYIMELGDDILTGIHIDPETYEPRSLASDLKRRGRLPLPECLEIAVQLTNALEYLHQQQLIHRDIKPSNIIFVNGIPKFADIGLVTDVATSSKDVSYLGTQGFIAPEGPGSASADVYSLGKVIYQAAFGMDPKRFPEIPTALVEETQDEGIFVLNRIVLKACENNPDLRYRSAAQLLTDLDALRLKVRPSQSA